MYHESTAVSLEPAARYSALLADWCDALISLQTPEGPWPSLSGGILCPACSFMHGRCMDAVYPLMRRAHDTNDTRYLDAAVRLMVWADHLRQPDGSWPSDPIGNNWCLTTIFGIIALGEALRHHGTLLDAAVSAHWRERLRQAVAYVEAGMPIVNNINYAMSSAASFAIAADVLDEPRYVALARTAAHDILAYFSERKLIFGEGPPITGRTPRGCRPIDLGYNVEESLPNLALYGTLTGDDEVLDMVTASLRAHLAFMLPDGGWDNSWGTRNFKWTYWGSRTSDGCQMACLLLADRDPRFAEAALRNIKLLAACTHGGILYGGPHYYCHGVLPCIHHTFCHAKTLAAALDYGVPAQSEPVPLPRETARGIDTYPEIATSLLAVGPWRATVTAYDWEYRPESHTSGGTMSLLWHTHVGALLTAGMMRYSSTIEPTNMQRHRDAVNQSLAPHAAIVVDGKRYYSENDFHAEVTVTELDGGDLRVEVCGQLVDADHMAPTSGAIPINTIYDLTADAITFTIAVHAPGVRYYLPLVSRHDEPVSVDADGMVTITKAGGTVRVQSTVPPTLPAEPLRIFSLVPGHEALPLSIEMRTDQPLTIRITVHPT